MDDYSSLLFNSGLKVTVKRHALSILSCLFSQKISLQSVIINVIKNRFSSILDGLLSYGLDIRSGLNGDMDVIGDLISIISPKSHLNQLLYQSMDNLIFKFVLFIFDSDLVPSDLDGVRYMDSLVKSLGMLVKNYGIPSLQLSNENNEEGFYVDIEKLRALVLERALFPSTEMDKFLLYSLWLSLLLLSPARNSNTSIGKIEQEISEVLERVRSMPDRGTFAQLSKALAVACPDHILSMYPVSEIDRSLLDVLLGEALEYCRRYTHKNPHFSAFLEVIDVSYTRLNDIPHVGGDSWDGQVCELVISVSESGDSNVRLKIESIFKKLLVRRSQIQVQVTDGCDLVLDKVLGLSWTAKTKYRLLSMMIEQDRVKVLTKMQKGGMDVVQVALSHIGDSDLANSIGKFISSFISCSSKEVVNALPCRLSVLLCAEDEMVRKNVEIFIMEPLVKSRLFGPDELTFIISSLPSNIHTQSARLAIMKIADKHNVKIVCESIKSSILEMLTHVSFQTRTDAFALAFGLSSKAAKYDMSNQCQLWTTIVEDHLSLTVPEHRATFCTQSGKFFKKLANVIKASSSQFTDTNRQAAESMILFLFQSFEKSMQFYEQCNSPRIDVYLALMTAAFDILYDRFVVALDKKPQVFTSLLNCLNTPVCPLRQKSFLLCINILEKLSSHIPVDFKELDQMADDSLSGYRINDLEYGALLKYIVSRFDENRSVEELLKDNILALQTDISALREDVVKASMTNPIQAQLVLARVICENNPLLRTYVQNEYLRIIIESCEIILPILSDPAPEGSLLDDDDNVLDSVATEQRSSYPMHYCWRIAHDSCILLNTLVNKFTMTDELEMIGDFLRQQLGEVRHCGAFCAFKTPFETVCEKAVINTKTLMGRWLTDDFESMFSSEKVISITRRSAGIPLMILSMVVAEVSASVNQKSCHCPLLKITMARCLEVALRELKDSELMENKIVLPQIHAINIIIALVRDTTIWDELDRWTEQLFIMSFVGQESKSWAMRNVSNMLYNALMGKMFRNKKLVDAQAFISKRPHLYEFIVKKLQTASKKSYQYSCLFSVCLTLSHLSVGRNNDGTNNKVYDLASQLEVVASTSHDYHIRRISSEAAVQLISQNTLNKRIDDWIQMLFDSRDSNRVHGIVSLIMNGIDSIGDIVSAQTMIQSEFGRLSDILLDDHIHSMARGKLLELLRQLKLSKPFFKQCIYLEKYNKTDYHILKQIMLIKMDCGLIEECAFALHNPLVPYEAKLAILQGPVVKIDEERVAALLFDNNPLIKIEAARSLDKCLRLSESTASCVLELFEKKIAFTFRVELLRLFGNFEFNYLNCERILRLLTIYTHESNAESLRKACIGSVARLLKCDIMNCTLKPLLYICTSRLIQDDSACIRT